MSDFTPITVTLRGPAKQKRPVEENEGFNGEGFVFEKVTMKYTVTVDTVDKFSKLLSKQSASSIAEEVLPEGYYVELKLGDEWEVSSNANANEALEIAECVADEAEDMSIVSVLTLWLQNWGGMRVRRALHTKLREEGLDYVDHVS